MEAVGVEFWNTHHTLLPAVFHVLLRVMVQCTTWQTAAWTQWSVQQTISVVLDELQHGSLAELCIKDVTAFLLEYKYKP